MQLRLLSALLIAAPVSIASAQIFTDTFDDGNAATRWSSPFFSAETGSIDGLVDYAFDYSTLTGFGGVPAAPGSGGTTIGLGVAVNNTNDPVDEGEAIGVSPLIPNLPGDYTVTAEVFIYYGGGAGSSEHAFIGANADGTAAPFTFATAGAGQFYHIPHNSGLGSTSFADDYYRVADGTLTELAGSNAAVPDPADLGISFPGPDGSGFNDDGYAGNQWFTLELTKTGNLLELFIEGVLLDSFDITGGATTGDIALGGADIFNSANDTNWIIFDNVVVVPEPAALMLLSLGLLAIRRR